MGSLVRLTMLSEGLRQRGHHVDIVSRADFPGLLVHEFRFSGFGLFWPSFRKKLADYDVINVHGPVPTMTEVFLLLMRGLPLYRRPGIVYTHHCDISLPGMARLCRWYNRAIEGLAHGADRIVVTSPDYLEKLTRHRGTPVHVIPWAASAAPGPPRTPPTPGRLRVLFVGQLRPYKGLAHLLSAVSGAAELELTIIGDGPMRAELEFRVRQEGLNNVRLLGRVPEDVLARAYANADVIASAFHHYSRGFRDRVDRGDASGVRTGGQRPSRSAHRSRADGDLGAAERRRPPQNGPEGPRLRSGPAQAAF